MDCKDIYNLTSAYIDGRCTEKDKIRLLSHIENCAACEAVFDQLTDMTAMLKKTEQLPLPEGYYAELSEKIQSQKKSPRVLTSAGAFARRLGQVAAVFLVTLTVLAVANTLFIGLTENGTGGGAGSANSTMLLESDVPVINEKSDTAAAGGAPAAAAPMPDAVTDADLDAGFYDTASTADEFTEYVETEIFETADRSYTAGGEADTGSIMDGGEADTDTAGGLIDMNSTAGGGSADTGSADLMGGMPETRVTEEARTEAFPAAEEAPAASSITDAPAMSFAEAEEAPPAEESPYPAPAAAPAADSGADIRSITPEDALQNNNSAVTGAAPPRTASDTSRDAFTEYIYQSIFGEESEDSGSGDFTEDEFYDNEPAEETPAAADEPEEDVGTANEPAASAVNTERAEPETADTSRRDTPAAARQPAAPSYAASVPAMSKIMRSVSVEIYTDDLYEAVSIINQLPGYSANSNVNYYNPEKTRQYGEAYFSRRIGVNEVEYARGILRGIGDVLNETESQRDMTNEYADLTVRARNAENEITRLLALVETSDTLENIVFIQNRIFDIDWRLDNYLGRIRQIDAQTRNVYMDINIYAQEPYVPIVYTFEEPEFAERMQSAFEHSLEFSQNAVEGFTVFAVSAFVPLLSCAVFIFIIVFIIRKIRKKSGYRPPSETEE